LHVRHDVDGEVDGQRSQFNGQLVEVAQTPLGQPLQPEGQALQFVPSYKYPELQPQHLLRLQELHPGAQQYPDISVYPATQPVHTSSQSQVVHLLKHWPQPPVIG
jgi:hypothetical protein